MTTFTAVHITLGSLINVPPRFFSFFFQKTPPLFLGQTRLSNFLLYESNSLTRQPFAGKKYLLSKKVISKASLNIFEVNI